MSLNLEKNYELNTYWKRCGGGVVFAFLAVILVLLLNISDIPGGQGLRPLLFIADPIQASIDTLGVLFVIALFVERANEIFVASARVVARKEAEFKIEKMVQLVEKGGRNAPKEDEIEDAKSALLSYRTGTRLVTITFSVIIATLLALAGVRALSPLLEVQFEALAKSQWFFLHLVDIILTVAIIGGGSNGIHRILSTIVDQFPDRKSSADAATEPK